MNPEFVAAMREVQAAAHANSRAKGFYDDEEILGSLAGALSRLQGDEAAPLTAEHFTRLRVNAVLARLSMIGAEVGEAIEAVRAGPNAPAFSVPGPFGQELQGTVLGSELADIVIRTMDLAAFTGVDLGAEIEAKMAKNATRGYKHGKLA